MKPTDHPEHQAGSMSNVKQALRTLVARGLEGKGTASAAQGRAAFDGAGVGEPSRTLIQKVARHAHQVSDEDIAAARASGMSEDQIFEIAVCAAIGQATRQYDAALAALDAP